MMNQPSSAYRPDIDGLRTIAVIPVILFHADFLLWHGGYIGVDVFFVISGFLISSILLKDLEGNRFSLATFYERRARRILLPLFVMALAAMITAYLLFIPTDFKFFGKTFFSLGFFGSNFIFWKAGGYFEPALENNPLLHTWSLAVEEQFYLLFPLLLAYLYKRYQNKLFLIFLLLSLLSFFVSIGQVALAPQAAFYLLPSRAWELLTGSLAAIVLRPWQENTKPVFISPLTCEILALSGLAAIILPVFFYSEATNFPGLAALLPTMGTVTLIWLGSYSYKTFTCRLLSLKPMVGIGLISYSLYLWHWPVLVFFKELGLKAKLSSAEALSALAISFFLAWLSWLFVEQPIRKRKILSGQKKLLYFSAALLITMVLIGAVPYKTNGWPSRFTHELSQLEKVEQDQNPQRSQCHLPQIDQAALERLDAKNFCRLGLPKNHPDFLSWGDSHMDALMPLWQKMAQEKHLYGWHISSSNGLPVIGAFRPKGDRVQAQKENYNAFGEKIIKTVQENKIKAVVMAAYWTYYLTQDIAVTRQDGTVATGETALAVALDQTVTALENAGANVWLVKQIPSFGASVPKIIFRNNTLGHEFYKTYLDYGDYQKQTGTLEMIFSQLAQKHPNLAFIDPAEILCADQKKCLGQAGDKTLYYDDNHLSSTGSLSLEPLLTELEKSLIAGAGNNYAPRPLSQN